MIALPWLYYIAPTVALVLTMGLLVAPRRHISATIAGIGIIVCCLGAVTLQLSRLEPGALGDLPKMGAVCIATLLPTVVATGLYLISGGLQPLRRAAVAAAVALPVVIAYPYVGILLVCALAGDCL